MRSIRKSASLTRKSDLVVVAQATGAFGVRGEVKIRPFTDDPGACLRYGPLLDANGEVVLTPKRHRSVKNALAVSAPEVGTREEAQSLNGTLLYVPRSALPEPEEDEFYFEDLVGLDVKSTEGRRIGTVVAVHSFGAGDMLEIKPKDGASFFHPFTKEAVPKVDIAAGRVVVEIVEAE